MTFLSSFFMLAVLAVFSSVHAYQPLSISSLKDFSSSSSYSVESAGGSVSATSVTPIYGSAAHHIPLSVNNKLEGRIKRTQRAHNGMMIETVDAVIAGCPSRDFSAQVNIGSQAFSIIVDTGSTTLGVAGSTCSCGPANPTYTPGTTASMVTSSTTAFVSSYGDKSTWSAAGYNDQVSVGNSKSAGTIFGSITQQTGFFQSSTCSGASGSQSQGIMGFAGPKLAAAANDNSGVNAQQWFAQYQAAAQVPDIFAIQMCLLTGDLWLGGYDNTTFSGELHWINIQPLTLVLSGGGTVTLNPGQAYYTVAVNSIGLTGFTADTNSGDYQGVNVNTIVDSGTTLMLIPTAAYNDILNALTNNYASQFNSIFGVSPSTFFTSGVCYQSGTSAENMNSMLPTMEVVLGGAQNNAPLYITLRAVSSYIEQSVSGGSTFYCPGIRASTSSTNILGWTFINQLIVAHDLRNLKLGFGLRTGCKDTSVGAFNVTGGETGVADAAIEGGSVTNTGAAGGGSDPGGNSSGIFNSLSGLSTTNIIIIVVAVVAGLIILLALCWCCQSRQKSMGEQTVQLSLERQQEQEFGKF